MGKCNFNPVWLKKDDGNGYKVSQWGKKEDEHSMFCIVCECNINISKGFQAIEQHAATNKHQTQCNLKINPLQLHLLSGCDGEEDSGKNNKSIRMYSMKDAATKAEIIWAMKTVAADFSASSSSGITDTFKAMFPESFPEGFCLNPKKIHYLISDGLAPYFLQKIKEDINNAYYTLMYDETTNSGNKKELQIVIRYWSKAQNKVVSQHLETFFLGSASADIVFNKIIEAMDRMALPRCKLLMLGSDGPNVNKKVHKLMKEELQTVCQRTLIDIGTCNIHIVHNAYLKGLNAFGEDACDLVTMLNFFFDGWPSRWAEFSDIQKNEGVPNNRFIKHCSSRWLTLKPAAERLLEQWPAILTYFLKHIPTKNSMLSGNRNYKNIASLIKKSTMKAELCFVISSANVFMKFTAFFQKDEPLVHILHNELVTLIKTLMGRFCTKSYLKSNKVDKESLSLKSNHLPLKEIVCSDAILKDLSENDKMSFLKSIQNHYLAACNHLLDKTSLSSGLLKNLHCLHPERRKVNQSCSEIVAVAKKLQLDVSHDVLLDEWKALQIEQDIKTEWNGERIDVYWNNLFSLKNSVKEKKYPAVEKIITAALVLSHGNAEVERGFSASGRTLTTDRASMSERTLSSILTLKSILKLYNNKPELVPITNDLLTYARSAYRHYENYLAEQKAIKEQEEKKKKEEEEEKAKRKANEEKLLKEKEIIAKCEENLKEKRLEEESKRSKVQQMLYFQKQQKDLRKE